MLHQQALILPYFHPVSIPVSLLCAICAPPAAAASSTIAPVGACICCPVHLRTRQGAVFVNWLRDGNEPADSSTSPEEEDGSCRRLRLQLDPDAFVPAFEAKGLTADRPVVVRGRELAADLPAAVAHVYGPWRRACMHEVQGQVCRARQRNGRCTCTSGVWPAQTCLDGLVQVTGAEGVSVRP